MRRQWKLYLLALGSALGATSNVLADGPSFTTIEFPGATLTNAFGINSRGDIVGNYLNADKSDHGFLLGGGKYSTIDFSDATFTSAGAINQRGDILGRYTLDGVSRGYLLVAFKPPAYSQAAHCLGARQRAPARDIIQILPVVSESDSPIRPLAADQPPFP